MTSDTVLFILITAADFSAAIVLLISALSDKMVARSAWLKAGLLIAALGVTAQGLRNLQFLITGVSPTDADLPLWALKDTGIAFIATYYAVMSLRGKDHA